MAAFPVYCGIMNHDGRDTTATSRQSSPALSRTYQVPRSFEFHVGGRSVTVGAFVRYKVGICRLHAKALDVLDYVGLAAHAESLAGISTPPQKRRLEVARALATEPKLLLSRRGFDGPHAERSSSSS